MVIDVDENIRNSPERLYKRTAFFLDLAKVCDTVPRTRLFEILESDEITGIVFKVFENNLKSMYQMIKLNGVHIEISKRFRQMFFKLLYLGTFYFLYVSIPVWLMLSY